MKNWLTDILDLKVAIKNRLTATVVVVYRDWNGLVLRLRLRAKQSIYSFVNPFSKLF